MTWRALHMLALFWMMGGIGSVVIPVWRAWGAQEIERRSLLLSEAQRNETAWLLPGMIAAGISGLAWAVAEEWNIFTTGWLLALTLVFAIDIFVFVPLLGVGLRRVHLLALQSKKRNEVSDELREALADNVPVVLGTLLVVSVPLMVWLPVFKPF